MVLEVAGGGPVLPEVAGGGPVLPIGRPGVDADVAGGIEEGTATSTWWRTATTARCVVAAAAGRVRSGARL
jgi:hypothetical protein